jgi:hypothetical protein
MLDRISKVVAIWKKEKDNEPLETRISLEAREW